MLRQDGALWRRVRKHGGSMATGKDECVLFKLSHDEVSIVTHELCDPLRPLLAVHLSSTAKGLREAMEEAQEAACEVPDNRTEPQEDEEDEDEDEDEDDEDQEDQADDE